MPLCKANPVEICFMHTAVATKAATERQRWKVSGAETCCKVQYPGAGWRFVPDPTCTILFCEEGLCRLRLPQDQAAKIRKFQASSASLAEDKGYCDVIPESIGGLGKSCANTNQGSQQQQAHCAYCLLSCCA